MVMSFKFLLILCFFLVYKCMQAKISDVYVCLSLEIKTFIVPMINTHLVHHVLFTNYITNPIRCCLLLEVFFRRDRELRQRQSVDVNKRTVTTHSYSLL